jgi:hypothetical protein
VNNRLIWLTIFENALFRYWTHASLEPANVSTTESNHKIGDLRTSEVGLDMDTFRTRNSTQAIQTIQLFAICERKLQPRGP